MTPEIAHETASQWNGMDVVGYILAASGLETVPSDRRFIHRLFLQFAQEMQDQPQSLMRDFVFATRDIFPFSRELEQALTYLELGGLLITDNPEFAQFRIREETRDIIKEEANELFSNEERERLDGLAKRLSDVERSWSVKGGSS